MRQPTKLTHGQGKNERYAHALTTTEKREEKWRKREIGRNKEGSDKERLS